MKIPPLFQYEAETNERILYANILLEMSDQQDDIHYANALEVSCVIQILAAYYALIEESQRGLNLIPQPGLSAQDVLSAMQKKEVHSAEIEKLASLENDRTSWITAIKKEYRELSSSPSMKGANIIGTQSISPKSQQGSGSTHDRYSSFIAELEKLRDRLRDSLAEY